MTKNNSFKKQVRARMQRTGETYKQAYDALYNPDRRTQVLDYLAGFGLQPMNSLKDRENIALDQFFSGATLRSITSVLSDEYRDGMILFAGKAASGKTMMMNAAVNTYMSCNPTDRIIAIEDVDHPETVLMPKILNGIVLSSKKEDTAKLITDAIRMRPNMVTIGEIINDETIHSSSVAGETGHQVMASIHATSFASAIGRLGRVDKLKVVIMQERFASDFGLLALRYALVVTPEIRTVLNDYLAHNNETALYDTLEALGAPTLETQKEKMVTAGILASVSSSAILNKTAEHLTDTSTQNGQD